MYMDVIVIIAFVVVAGFVAYKKGFLNFK